MRRPLTTTALLLLPVASASVWLAGTRPSQPKSVSGPVDVTTETQVHAVGYVEPITGVRRLSFQAGGIVESHLEMGVAAGRGSVLATLVNDDRRAQLRLAECELLISQAERDQVLSGVHARQLEMAQHHEAALQHRLRYLEKSEQRAESLLAQRASSLDDHEQSLSRLLSARENLKRAKANVGYLRDYVTPEDKALAEARVSRAAELLRVADAELAKTEIRAPFDGVVLDVLVREGEAVDELTKPAVILFGDISAFRIRCEVDARYARLLRPGMRAAVSGVNLDGQEFQGKVEQVKLRTGNKRVFSSKPTERRSLEIVEVFVCAGDEFSAPVGLMVDVTILLPPDR